MKKMKSFRVVAGLGMLLVVLSGCASDPYKQGDVLVPKAQFKGYKSYVLQPTQVEERLTKYRTLDSLVAKVNLELPERLKLVFKNLEVAEKSSLKKRNALSIEPTVVDMKFVNSRVSMASAFRGGSRIKMKVVFRDLNTGKVVDQVEVFRKSSNAAGIFTMSGSDYATISKAVWDVLRYVVDDPSGK